MPTSSPPLPLSSAAHLELLEGREVGVLVVQAHHQAQRHLGGEEWEVVDDEEWVAWCSLVMVDGDGLHAVVVARNHAQDLHRPLA